MRIINTRQYSRDIDFNLSITTGVTGSYTAGVLLGHKITLSGVADNPGGYFTVRQLILRDQSNQSVTVDAVLFSANPASTTFTNKTALDVDDNDLSKVQAIWTMSAWHPFADNAVSIRNGLDTKVQLSTAQNSLYLGLIVRTAFTGVAATDWSGRLTIDI